MPSTRPSPSVSSSQDAFSKVDELVSKPVVGSDGAASWQAFRSEHKSSYHRASAAPRAPLKKADKLGTGFASWREEEAHEAGVRKASGHGTVHSGYTNFAKKGNDEEEQRAAQRKRAKLIESRQRPDDKEYYIKAETFEGWKFDYVFTTRNGWGTGYFWDGMDSVKKLNGKLRDDQVQSSTDGGSSNDFNGSESKSDDRKHKKKKKRKRLAGPVIVEDPNNPRAQLQAVLQRRNQLMGGGATVDPTLPPKWEAAVDPTTKKTYYYNRTTGERAWEKPAVSPERTSPSDGTDGSAADGISSIGLPEGWSETKDPVSDKPYYYHTSGRTSWERPT